MAVLKNETLDTLFQRRSIRKYKPEMISEDELETILQAGIWAPSGMNRQSCRLVVIRQPERLKRLYALAMEFPNRGGNPFYDAPLAVIAFANSTATSPVQDASLAIGNMANAAASIGVGSCWINCVKDLFQTPEGREFKKEICPEEEYIPVGSLILGYADEQPQPKPREEGRIRFY